MKKLYKSKTDKKLESVCAGIGKYLNIDPTVVRDSWAIACLGTLGIPAYIACAFIIPEKPDNTIVDAEQ